MTRTPVGPLASDGRLTPMAGSPRQAERDHRHGRSATLLCLALAALLAYLALTPLPPFASDVYGSLTRRYVIVGVVLLGYCVWLLVARRLPRRSPFDVPLAAVSGAVLIAVARSADPRVSFEAVLPLLPTLVLFYVLHDATPLDARWLARLVTLAAGVVAVFALASVWRSLDEWWTLVRAVEGRVGRSTLLPPATPRIEGVGNHPNVLGSLFAMSLPAMLLVWTETRHRVERAATALGALLLIIALFFTLSRGAWVAAAAGLCVSAGAALVGARSGVRGLPRNWVILGLVVVSLTLIALVVLRADARPDWLFRNSLDPRADMRRVGWEIFRDNPVRGVGPGLYVALYPIYGGAHPFAAVHAHNLVVQTAADMGLVGLAAGALLLGTALLVAIRGLQYGSPPQRRGVAAASGMLAALLVHGLADAPQHFPEVQLLAAIALVMLARGAGTAVLPLPRVLDRWRERSRVRVLGRAAAWVGRAAAVLFALTLPVAWAMTSHAHVAYASSIDAAKEQRWPEAVAAARRARDRDDQMAVYWFQLGAAHATAAIEGDRRREQERALGAYQRGLELEPHNGAALVNYAALQIVLGHPDRARETLPALARLAGRDSLLLLAHATITQWTASPEQAIDTYAGLLVVNPSLGATPFWRDNGFRAANFNRIVDRALERVPEVVGDGPAAESLRTSIELYAGRAAPSAQSLQAALAARPDDVGLGVAVGRLLMASEATRAQAYDVLRRAVAIKGDDPAARAALGDWYAQDGAIEQARREWAAASHLGDLAATVSLGESFPEGSVPDAVHARGKQLLRATEVERFYLLFQTFRFTFQRVEPNPIILPGDWLLALPSEFAAWKAAVESWGDGPTSRPPP